MQCWAGGLDVGACASWAPFTHHAQGWAWTLSHLAFYWHFFFRRLKPSEVNMCNAKFSDIKLKRQKCVEHHSTKPLMKNSPGPCSGWPATVCWGWYLAEGDLNSCLQEVHSLVGPKMEALVWLYTHYELYHILNMAYVEKWWIKSNELQEKNMLPIIRDRLQKLPSHK